MPVMLLDDVRQTMDIIPESLRRARNQPGTDDRVPEYCLESLGISEEEKEGIVKLAYEGSGQVDPVVA
ncbi:MAG: hypothetical protein ACREBC_10400 [Pyrinomonadaceae bacterium]